MTDKYILPLRIVSGTRPGAAIIHDLTRGKAGGPHNEFTTLRAAGGVCHDIRRRVNDARVVDGSGADVPDALWRDALLSIRTGGGGA